MKMGIIDKVRLAQLRMDITRRDEFIHMLEEKLSMLEESNTRLIANAEKYRTKLTDAQNEMEHIRGLLVRYQWERANLPEAQLRLVKESKGEKPS